MSGEASPSFFRYVAARNRRRLDFSLSWNAHVRLTGLGLPFALPTQAFGPPDANHKATSKLPQHGFARTARWEFLGKSTSEGSSSSVKLDFGLSPDNLDEATRTLWPYKVWPAVQRRARLREPQHDAGRFQQRRRAI